MSIFELKMPKMGESVEEATIVKWLVSEGDQIEEDQNLAEIASDKVDTEIPSPVAGTVKELVHGEDELVEVGQVIARIDMGGDEEVETQEEKSPDAKPKKEESKQDTGKEKQTSAKETRSAYDDDERFYSPLVKTIAAKEGISKEELKQIDGTGRDGRVTKNDILDYIDDGRPAKDQQGDGATKKSKKEAPKTKVKAREGDEVVEMDRMRKIIAEHMVASRDTSVHVTSVVEADVTELVRLRGKNKARFGESEGVKLTYLPFFVEAVAKNLKEFPRVNASVSGENIILRKDINIGIAVALEDDNLVVPVLKNADEKNIAGLAKGLDELANKARSGKLRNDDLDAGTFSITNFGSFRNLFGTPIIHQPQVAILATGSIQKVPAVVETPSGDMIGIRHKMFLSLTYDHRIVDGALGGRFLRRLADRLEQVDVDREII